MTQTTTQGLEELDKLAEILWCNKITRANGSVAYMMPNGEHGHIVMTNRLKRLRTYILQSNEQELTKARLDEVEKLNSDMYDFMPTGDVTAWDMLKAVTGLQAKWSNRIDALTTQLKKEINHD